MSAYFHIDYLAGFVGIAAGVFTLLILIDGTEVMSNEYPKPPASFLPVRPETTSSPKRELAGPRSCRILAR